MSKLMSVLFALPLVVAACGGAESPPKAAKVQPMAAGDDGHALCVQAFQRQRTCTAEFIPALVAARVRNDKPPGIAAKDTEIGRAALVAQANEEWKTDSTDEAIDATCTRMAGQMPPEGQQRVQQCLAADNCNAFVECLIPVIESHLH